MSYQLKVIKDYPIGFWPLDESSGTIANDISGCTNNGTYVGGLQDNILPLVPGGISGNLINNSKSIILSTNKDYYASTASGGIADIDSSDNDFTLEIWISHNISTTNKTTIFADSSNGIGLFYEKGSILFQLENEYLYYHLNNNNKAMHIVATYTISAMSLYIDGQIVASKPLSGFKFTNSSVLFSIGPTSSSNDSFIVDAPAVYRHSLSKSRIYEHYLFGIYHVNPIQFIKTDNGKLFPLHEEFISPAFIYNYNNPDVLKRFTTEDTYYNQQAGYITFYKTETAVAKTAVFEDIINVPSELGITSSKIEWKSDYGISVETSLDGINYVSCTNGSWLPQYTKGISIDYSPLYVRITMETSDASKYLPRFSKFTIKFYSDKNLNGENTALYATSDSDYSMGSFNYPPLSRNAYNGLRTVSGGGFKINSPSDISTLEFLYTPSALSASTLINNVGANYSWNGSGTISKTNISKIYVNGVDKTSATNISNVFLSNNLHYIVIAFSSAISGDLKFNYNSSGGPANLFKNIAFYDYSFTETLMLEHLNFYAGRPLAVSSDTSLQVTAIAPEYYKDDWLLVQNT
jgi:hypothetical protein